MIGLYLSHNYIASNWNALFQRSIDPLLFTLFMALAPDLRVH